MILLSNLLKPASYTTLDDKKMLQFIAPIQPANEEQDQVDLLGTVPNLQAEIELAHSMKAQIVQDAESFAKDHIDAAIQEAEQMKETALLEIEKWWQERRSMDEAVIQETQEKGFQDGYKQGTAEAIVEVKQQHAEMLHEAQSVLQQAFLLKEQIIQEAEPFLIELSCAIAEKIVHTQLTLSPDLVIDYMKTMLSRRKEKGVVTLCVSPNQFAYIQDARDELLTTLDSQAELQILPDSSVADHGCVLRTTYGSMDARIDTQLNEIKSALQQIALRSEGAKNEYSNS